MSNADRSLKKLAAAINDHYLKLACEISILLFHLIAVTDELSYHHMQNYVQKCMIKQTLINLALKIRQFCLTPFT